MPLSDKQQTAWYRPQTNNRGLGAALRQTNNGRLGAGTRQATEGRVPLSDNHQAAWFRPQTSNSEMQRVCDPINGTGLPGGFDLVWGLVGVAVGKELAVGGVPHWLSEAHPAQVSDELVGVHLRDLRDARQQLLGRLARRRLHLAKEFIVAR